MHATGEWRLSIHFYVYRRRYEALYPVMEIELRTSTDNRLFG